MSPLTAILCLIVLVTIPSLIYAFFFAFKCTTKEMKNKNENHVDEMVCNKKYTKEMSENGLYGSECPVCLSLFVEGEEIKQLSSCKHTFHVSCIDKWLRSRSSCPVCRASVPVKRGKRLVVDGGGGGGGEEDLRHGLPDASSLV